MHERMVLSRPDRAADEADGAEQWLSAFVAASACRIGTRAAPDGSEGWMHTRRQAIADSIAKAMDSERAQNALRLLDRAVVNQKDELIAARRGTGVLSKGPSSNPLNDADAYEAVRRALANHRSQR